MGEIIRLEHVAKINADGTRVINDVSFAVREGQTVTFAGSSQSGAMLARLIAGMEKSSEGFVFVQNQPIHELDERAAADFRNKAIGFVQGDPIFMPALPVWENIALPLTMQGVPIAERKKRVFEQIENLGLLYAINARPKQLSPLERALASLARATVTQPRILLFDDCTKSLSEREVRHFVDMLQTIAQTGNFTMLFFTQSEKEFPRVDLEYRFSYGTLEVNG